MWAETFSLLTCVLTAKRRRTSWLDILFVTKSSSILASVPVLQMCAIANELSWGAPADRELLQIFFFSSIRVRSRSISRCDVFAAWNGGGRSCRLRSELSPCGHIDLCTEHGHCSFLCTEWKRLCGCSSEQKVQRRWLAIIYSGSGHHGDS